VTQQPWHHVREAQRLEHHWIGCGHLLLNVLADEEGPAARVLAQHGVTLEFARRRIAELCGGAGDPDTGGHTSSPRATVVTRLAEIEAERLDQGDPTGEHVILVMLTEGAGVPNGLFAECGVDRAVLRAEGIERIARRMESHGQSVNGDAYVKIRRLRALSTAIGLVLIISGVVYVIA